MKIKILDPLLAEISYAFYAQKVEYIEKTLYFKN